MTRILYERKDDSSEGIVEIRGNRMDAIEGVCSILRGMEAGMGMSIERFSATLPALMALGMSDVKSTTMVDLNEAEKILRGDES